MSTRSKSQSTVSIWFTLRISSKPWRWSIITSRCLSRTAIATKSWNCVERWSEKRTSQRRMMSTHSNSRLNQIKSQRKQKNKFKASHFSKRIKGNPRLNEALTFKAPLKAAAKDIKNDNYQGACKVWGQGPESSCKESRAGFAFQPGHGKSSSWSCP